MPRLKPLNLVLAGVDRISAPIERINRRIDRLGKPIRTVTNRLRRLDRAAGFANLRRSVVAAGAAVKGLAASTAALVGQLALIGGLVGFGAARSLFKIAEAGDEIAKTSDNLGIAVDEFQALEHVAALSGVSSEKFRKSMSRLAKSVGDAMRGSIEAKFAFETLGVDVIDPLSGQVKGATQLLGELGDGFQRITSPTLKAFFAQTLFSRSGARMVKMLDLQSEGIKAATDRVYELGGVMGEKLARESERWIDNWTDLKAVVKGLAFVLAGPLITATADLFKAWVDYAVVNKEMLRADVRAWGKRAAEGFLELVERIRVGIPKAQALVERLGGLSGIAKILGLVLVAQLVPAIVATAAAIWAIVPAVLSLALALLTTPVGWIVLGIAAIAAAGVLLVKKWEPVRDFFADLFSGWIEKLEAVVGWVGKLGGRISGGVGDYLGSLGFEPTDMTAPRVRAPLSEGVRTSPRADAFDGRLEISISQDRPPEVRRLITSQPGLDLSVETGMTLIPAT